MIENELREKVIKGLECCMSGQPDGLGCSRVPCPYNQFEDCEGILHRDTLALLKAQEPRVLIPEEVRNDGIIVWYEVKGEEPYPCIVGKYDPNSLFFMGTIGHGVTTISEWDEYGKTWRCWTSKPTDEQREEIPWN